MSSHRVLHDIFEAPFAETDPGASGTLTSTRWFGCWPIVTAAAEARTLAQPTKAGMVTIVALKTDGGNLTLTVTGGYNPDADTDLTFGDAGDYAVFVSVDVGGSFYWRSISGVGSGIAELMTEAMNIHVLTAAGAVPDVSDRLAFSDESATGDPTLYATVTELLSAIGDLTDLGAVPDVADRIALTDESASGDPAKSTTVENFFSALGDVTALGVYPAAEDRLACTDEDVAGDPIRSVTVAELLTSLNRLDALGAAPATNDQMLITDQSAPSDPAVYITVAELFQTYIHQVTVGSGISSEANATVEHVVTHFGTIYHTTIAIDLTDLASGDGADIIGDDGGAANCHIGQVTAAVHGTIFLGKITCLETPAGGTDDIDLWYADEDTGTENALVSGLTNEVQCINHGAWAAGEMDVLTAFPAADKYLYLAGGAAGDAAYTAGKFLIEMWGV